MAHRMAVAMANRMAKPMRSLWQKDAPNPNPNPNPKSSSRVVPSKTLDANSKSSRSVPCARATIGLGRNG